MVLTFSQISVILSLNFSLFFHSVTNAAIRTPIAAPTAMTAPDAPLKTALSFANNPVPVFVTLETLTKTDERLDRPFIATPTLLITVPRITSAGPIAATIMPIFAITFCCAGVSALNLSVSFCTKSMTF